MYAPRIAAAIALSTAFLAAGCSHPLARAAADTTVTLEFGGLQRQYLIHYPANHPPGALPAVLVFHGGGGSAQNTASAFGFDKLSDADGFLAIYPEGYEKSWNDGRGDDTNASAANIDDVGFVAAVIDRLIANDSVDPARVYATGMSNGGMFTEDLGCRLSDKLAAIAPVAGPLPEADVSACAPTHSLPVLEIHGTSDPIVPYDGGVVRITSGHHGAGSSPVLSVDATQQLWREKNACDAASTTQLPQRTDDGTSVTVQSSDCANGTTVQLYSIANGGHTWPGGPQYLPQALVGKVSHQFDASEVIWRFLSQFRKQPG
ncbi:extracellular catalytic domain type 1 short-chain-length polyhydroxyalkanoate depolymerase [Nocardia sp. CDC160]|uniref:extracellular catalytic domain type 1 short-chain-length polyhydroxyalkanoate depolymerase n=1 Tax=Nocardia sp. CDC160 TaxID=3112166 RepID=UPI002DBE30BA|nr:PHB depolymerase family esterase [Nocardia sp. CDC160]MEC3917853.1 PHB depolymerase family esterase [Nocardia sp. CDC160]